MNDSLLVAVEANMWRKLTDRLQMSALIGIFVMIFILDHVSKHTAHWLVWYLAGVEFILATISFFCSRKYWNLQQKQFDLQSKRIKEMVNGKESSTLR